MPDDPFKRLLDTGDDWDADMTRASVEGLLEQFSQMPHVVIPAGDDTIRARLVEELIVPLISNLKKFEGEEMWRSDMAYL